MSIVLNVRRAVITVLLAAAAGFCFAPVRAVAQAPATPSAEAPKYKTDTVPREVSDTKNPRFAELRRLYPQVLSGDAPLDEIGKRALDDWFVVKSFGEMTLPAYRERLATDRQALRLLFRQRVKNDAVHDYMNQIVLAKMIKVAGDTYHPAVRHNAMLVIGDLNQKEPVAGANATPAVPLAAALTTAGGLLSSAGDATLPAEVRVAALVGILRHAENKMPAGAQVTTQGAMVAIMKEKATTDAAYWMKARAADICGTLGTSGTGGAVATELANVLNDAATPVGTRCAAAKALGTIKALDAGAIKLAEVAAGLGNLQLDVCRQELARATRDGDGVSARQIHFQTACVNKALVGTGTAGGIVRLSKGAEKPLVDGVAKNVTEILALVPDETAQPTDEIKAKADALEKLLTENNVLRSPPSEKAADATTTAAAMPPAK